jgi:elongation factor Ts
MGKLEQIKKLRAETGAGIVDVKKALDEAGGDETKALDILKKSGQAKAIKKSDRHAGEGILGFYIHSDQKTGAMVKVSCETDFVARNEEFQAFARDIAMQIVSMNPSVVKYEDLDPVMIEKETEGIIATVKEKNIELKRLKKPLKNVPQFISRAQITDEIMKKIEEDIKAELKEEGKPEEIWDKIIPGKIDRFIADNTAFDKENVLLFQDFVKDPDKTIQDLLNETIAKMGENIEIKEFVRFEI